MANTLSPQKAALTIAILLGGWHLLWSLLVLAGWAQPLLDWVFQLHMIQPVYTVQPFSLSMSALLVLVTAAAGYVVGWIFAAVWNALMKK